MLKEVEQCLIKLKSKISDTDQKISETDTRQGLINPLLRALGWDFSDFNSVKSEYRYGSYNEPADYAFFSRENKEIPILVLEAKALGCNLDNPKRRKQLCNYLGQMGTQWGVLSDGSRYVMYNSKRGTAYEHWQFMTLSIKKMDTDDGLPVQKLAEMFVRLLSKDRLENKDIQKAYEEHMVKEQIQNTVKNALESLLAEPFDTLAKAIRNEFKQERVATYEGKISKNQIISCLKSLADEDGNIQIDTNMSFDTVENDYDEAKSATQNKASGELENNSRKKQRVSISSLISADMAKEGDNWKLTFKGDVFWGRVTGNGEIEVDGKFYSSPTRAAKEAVRKMHGEISVLNGWKTWEYKDKDGSWKIISVLREEYKSR